MVCALDPAELGHQQLGHPPVGAGLDRVHRAQQQRDQRIGDLPAAARRQDFRPIILGRISDRAAPDTDTEPPNTSGTAD